MSDANDEWRGRRVAVTGATGFLGHYLAQELRARGALVRALVREPLRAKRLARIGVECVRVPLDDVSAIAEACRGCELLFHLAAKVDFSDDWEAAHAIHVVGTRRVFEAARVANIRRFIHTSSILTIGASSSPISLDESAHWNLINYTIPYITTKRMAEDMLLSVHGGPEVVVVNPAGMLGPDEIGSSELGSLCARFWKGRLPYYFAGGHNFVDVRDVAKGHLLAATRGRAGQRYILGGENRQWRRFFRELAQIDGGWFPQLPLPRSVGPMIALWNRPANHSTPGFRLSFAHARLLSLYFFFDSSKARRELGYSPRPLAETLADCHAGWRRAG